jgi:hypothetical protein
VNKSVQFDQSVKSELTRDGVIVLVWRAKWIGEEYSRSLAPLWRRGQRCINLPLEGHAPACAAKAPLRRGGPSWPLIWQKRRGRAGARPSNQPFKSILTENQGAENRAYQAQLQGTTSGLIRP